MSDDRNTFLHGVIVMESIFFSVIRFGMIIHKITPYSLICVFYKLVKEMKPQSFRTPNMLHKVVENIVFLTSCGKSGCRVINLILSQA